MSDDKKPFTVTDRRHFTAEGRARETEPAEGPVPAPPRAEAERPRVGPPEPPDRVAAESADGFDRGDEMDARGDEGDLPPFPTDLLGLIGSLATQATVLLAGDPATRRPPAPPELDAVRSIIALLDVLHDKTANNRDAQEERVLAAVRYELKMAFVARTRAGGA